MQLNKVLKGLLLALPVLAVAACSSNKSANNDQSGMGAGTGMENGSSNLSSEEQARLQMQELQKNNIVYFGLDKYDVSSEFAQMLDAHAAFLRNNPSYKVTVEGHADERGTPEYNIALGERRANAVKCTCRVKAFPLTRSLSFLTVKKNQQYWATTKRLMLKTVVPFWFTKRIA